MELSNATSMRDDISMLAAVSATFNKPVDLLHCLRYLVSYDESGPLNQRPRRPGKNFEEEKCEALISQKEGTLRINF